MKHISSLFAGLMALAILAVSVPVAHGQSQGLMFPGSTTTAINGGTNNVPIGSSNNYALRIDVPRASDFYLHISGKPSLTNKFNLTFTFAQSPDGTTFDTHSLLSYTFSGATNALQGGTFNLTTNINVGAIPYLMLTTILNNESLGFITNLTVNYGFKR